VQAPMAGGVSTAEAGALPYPDDGGQSSPDRRARATASAWVPFAPSP
jgi:hypothetical protein